MMACGQVQGRQLRCYGNNTAEQLGEVGEVDTNWKPGSRYLA